MSHTPPASCCPKPVPCDSPRCDDSIHVATLPTTRLIPPSHPLIFHRLGWGQFRSMPMPRSTTSVVDSKAREVGFIDLFPWQGSATGPARWSCIAQSGGRPHEQPSVPLKKSSKRHLRRQIARPGTRFSMLRNMALIPASSDIILRERPAMQPHSQSHNFFGLVRCPTNVVCLRPRTGSGCRQSHSPNRLSPRGIRKFPRIRGYATCLSTVAS